MRRQIAPYPTRIPLDYVQIYGSAPHAGPFLVCMGEGDIELIRKLLGYAKRRIQWYADWSESAAYYLGLDDSEYKTVIDAVDDLEGRLMAVVCQQELIDALNDIRDSIDANGNSIDGLSACVCAIQQMQEQVAGRLPSLDGYEDIGLVNYLDPTASEGTPSDPATDEAKCELAQAFWYYVFQMYTEQLLPWANGTADSLTAALIATSTFSALAGFIGLPVAVLSAIVAAVIAWGIDGSISNFTNWLLGTKDEIICLLYNNYPDYAAAAAAVKGFIDEQTEISFLDRQLAKVVFGSSWHMTWVSMDQQENGTWNDYMVPGQCDDCEPIPPGCIEIGPCNLADWTNGTVVCTDGRAEIRGGLSYWNKQTAIPPASSYLVVYWIPNTDGAYPTAETNFGLTRASDMAHFNIINGPPQADGVPVIEYAAIPSTLWGNEVYFDMQQAAYFGQPIYWCLTDTPPT